MATSQYTYHPYHTIGAATILLWDSAAGGTGAWQPLGKAADAAVLMSTEQVGKDITIKGLTQPVARRNRAKSYSLSFRLLEDANPTTLDLLMSEGDRQTAASSMLVTSSEVIRLFATDYAELSHPYGILNAPPEGVSGVQASAGGTGGSITPGTYYYWVVPVGGGIEGVPAATGQLSVQADEQVTIDFVPPAGYTPDEYRVYFAASDQLIGAQLAGSGFSGTQIVLSSHTGGGSYSAISGIQLSVASYDGVQIYIADTDYALDITKGLIKRISGGAINSGQQVVVTYTYARPASVLTDLGDAVDLERYRKVKLLQLAPDDPDPANWRETGVEFTFFKVNVSMNDSRWPFAEDDFSEGASVTWDALFDGSEAKVGEVRSTYGVLSEFE